MSRIDYDEKGPPGEIISAALSVWMHVAPGDASPRTTQGESATVGHSLEQAAPGGI